MSRTRIQQLLKFKLVFSPQKICTGNRFLSWVSLEKVDVGESLGFNKLQFIRMKIAVPAVSSGYMHLERKLYQLFLGILLCVPIAIVFFQADFKSLARMMTAHRWVFEASRPDKWCLFESVLLGRPTCPGTQNDWWLGQSLRPTFLPKSQSHTTHTHTCTNTRLVFINVGNIGLWFHKLNLPSSSRLK